MTWEPLLTAPLAVPAKPLGIWTLALDYVDANTVLKIATATDDETWDYAVGQSCGPDGDLDSSMSNTGCLVQSAPVGAMVGKIGGSTAGADGATAFIVGRNVVHTATEGGPLYLTINDELSGMSNNSGAIKVNVWKPASSEDAQGNPTAAVDTPALLEELSYTAWEPTKTTLHLYSQIVGKIALRSSALRNHWWNCTLKPTARGLRTDRLSANGTSFDIELDFVDHRVVVRAALHDEVTFPLHDGLSVAEFFDAIRTALRAFGIQVPILAKPYGVPALTTPFAQDREHRSYDAAAVRRWWNVVRWSSDVFERFASEFAGKQGPVQLFWHSFDLALGRYNGRRAAGPPKDDPVAREAYSHEVIAFGFWAGDVNIPAPTYYTYTAPEPSTLTSYPLRPDGAAWNATGAGHMGTVPYDVVRSAADPEAALMAFLHSSYEAGSRAGGWDVAGLAHDAAAVRS